MIQGLRISGAIMVWLALAVLLIWGGFTGRLPAVLGAILAPGQMDTGKDRASALTTEAGTTETTAGQSEATGSGAFSDNAATTLVLFEDWP